MNYKERRDKGIIIDSTNIHLYAKPIDVNEERRKRENKCAGCGTYVPTGQHGPGGLCGECNAKARWNDEPPEDFEVGFDMPTHNRPFFDDEEEDEDPDVGF